MLCSVVEHGMMPFNFQIKFFCAVCKQNGIIPCCITEQSTTSYVLTVLEHSHIHQRDGKTMAFLHWGGGGRGGRPL